jgi:hypothetical protein
MPKLIAYQCINFDTKNGKFGGVLRILSTADRPGNRIRFVKTVKKMLA